MLGTSSFNFFSFSFFIVHIYRQLFRPLRLIIHSQQQFSLFMRNVFEMKTFEEIYLSTRSKSPNQKCASSLSLRLSGIIRLKNITYLMKTTKTRKL
jgi:hypothetical protein